MVRKAIAPSLLALPIAFLIGRLAGGTGAGVSAAIAIAIVWLNFSVHGLSLAWASTISLPVVQGVALGGLVVRLGVIVAAMFALGSQAWYSPLAFGLALVPATLLLLVHEARLAMRGLGGSLQIPPDPAAVRAAEVLTARGVPLDAR
jgi:hypothetical protein